MKKSRQQRKQLLREINRMEKEICSTCPVMEVALPLIENCMGCSTYKELNHLGNRLIESTAADRRRRGIRVRDE